MYRKKHEGASKNGTRGADLLRPRMKGVLRMSIYSEIKPEVRMFAGMCVENSKIDPELFVKYDVKRGLRDLNGKGVLTGLTNISEIISSKTVTGRASPARASCTTAVTAWRNWCAASPRGTTLALSGWLTCCFLETCRTRAL